MIRLIHDCDPGQDDAIALMVILANPDRVRPEGVTTVAGNQTIEKVTFNVLSLLSFLGHPEIPVSEGAGKPLIREAEPQPAFHGESGMEGAFLPAPTRRATGISAAEFMHRALAESTEPLTILATGPLTNLALFLLTYPGDKDLIGSIRIMGGSLYSGNTLPRAEFNIYHDPEAARIVFSSGIPIVMSGIEVCQKAAVPYAKYEELRGNGPVSDLVANMLDCYSAHCRKRGLDALAIYDLTAAMELLHPEIFSSEMMNIEIETGGEYCRGMTVADTRPGVDKPKTTRVLTDVDRERYIEYFQQSIRTLDDRLRA